MLLFRNECVIHFFHSRGAYPMAWLPILKAYVGCSFNSLYLELGIVRVPKAPCLKTSTKLSPQIKSQFGSHQILYLKFEFKIFYFSFSLLSFYNLVIFIIWDLIPFHFFFKRVEPFLQKNHGYYFGNLKDQNILLDY